MGAGRRGGLGAGGQWACARSMPTRASGKRRLRLQRDLLLGLTDPGAEAVRGRGSGRVRPAVWQPGWQRQSLIRRAAPVDDRPVQRGIGGVPGGHLGASLARPPVSLTVGAVPAQVMGRGHRPPASVAVGSCAVSPLFAESSMSRYRHPAFRTASARSARDLAVPGTMGRSQNTVMPHTARGPSPWTPFWRSNGLPATRCWCSGESPATRAMAAALHCAPGA